MVKVKEKEKVKKIISQNCKSDTALARLTTKAPNNPMQVEKMIATQ